MQAQTVAVAERDELAVGKQELARVGVEHHWLVPDRADLKPLDRGELVRELVLDPRESRALGLHRAQNLLLGRDDVDGPVLAYGHRSVLDAFGRRLRGLGREAGKRLEARRPDLSGLGVDEPDRAAAQPDAVDRSELLLCADEGLGRIDRRKRPGFHVAIENRVLFLEHVEFVGLRPVGGVDRL